MHQPAHIVKLTGPQHKERWELNRLNRMRIGSGDGSEETFIDLTPDAWIRHTEGFIWHENNAWYISTPPGDHDSIDSRSYATITPPGLEKIFLDGHPHRLQSWSEIEVGGTRLLFVDRHWRRLRHGSLVIDISWREDIYYAHINAHAPPIRRMTIHNDGKEPYSDIRLAIELAALDFYLEHTVDQLFPGERKHIKLPAFNIPSSKFWAISKPGNCALSLLVNGKILQPSWKRNTMHPINAWPLGDDGKEWMSLAGFVQKNHQTVSITVTNACGDIKSKIPPADAIEKIFHYMFDACDISYRAEWHTGQSQLIRPHELIIDYLRDRKGEGTCLDLAVFIAACLENAILNPLIAILNTGKERHALVGCWKSAGAGGQPIVRRNDFPHLQERALWVDPNGCTQAPHERCNFDMSRKKALEQLTNNEILFVLDVAAARKGFSGVNPMEWRHIARLSKPVIDIRSEAERIAETYGIRQSTLVLFYSLLLASTASNASIVLFKKLNIDVKRLRKTCLERIKQREGNAEKASDFSRFQEILEASTAIASRYNELVVHEEHLLRAILNVPGEDLRNTLSEAEISWVALNGAVGYNNQTVF